MAHFYASIEGQSRRTATRWGGKNTGIEGHIRGWTSGVVVQGYYDAERDCDVFDVYQTSGSGGSGSRRLIATVRNGIVTLADP